MKICNRTIDLWKVIASSMLKKINMRTKELIAQLILSEYYN